MPDRFLAIATLKDGDTDEGVREALHRLADQCSALGLRAVETFYTLDRHRAYSLLEAPSPKEVREAHVRAGLGEPEVARVERVFTELLQQPHRAR